MTERPSAVRLFAPDNPTLARTLRGHLEQRKRDLSAQVADGFAQDWPDYKVRIGTIKGLTEAIDLCATVEDELNGEQ